MLKSTILGLFLLATIDGQPIKDWRKQDIPAFKADQFLVTDPIPTSAIENNFIIQKLEKITQFQAFSKEKQIKSQTDSGGKTPQIKKETNTVSLSNIIKQLPIGSSKDVDINKLIELVENKPKTNLRQVVYQPKSIYSPYYYSRGTRYSPYSSYSFNNNDDDQSEYYYLKKSSPRSYYYFQDPPQSNIRTYASSIYNRYYPYN